MKILLIGSHSAVCGAAFSMLKLIEELNKLGVNVTPVTNKGFSHELFLKNNQEHYVVSTWPWAISNRYSKIRAFVIKLIKKSLNVYSFFQYVKLIKKVNPDIVHVNALTIYVPVLAAIICHKPVVWHIRELMEEDLNSHFWNKEKAHVLMKKANHFIAISECVKAKYEKIVGSEKITCVYNGIDVNRFFSPNHKIFLEDKITITLAGRIYKSKGQLKCLLEIAPLLKKFPNMVLQFAGVGSKQDIDEIIQVRKQLDLSDDQVKLLGYVENMAALWAESDIAIVYSTFEAFGRVTVEAKMAGVLVVGFNSGGTTELIENGKDGYLFGNGYPSLSETLEHVLSEKSESAHIAEYGRTKAIELFSSKKNAEQVLDVYKKVLNG